MSKKTILILLCIVGFSGIHISAYLSVDPLIEINRVKLEERLEERLKKRLSALLQDESIFVIVKIRLSGEKININKGTIAGDDEYALPGVPVEVSLTERKKKEEDPVIEYITRISNVYAWIFLTKDIPGESMEKAKLISTGILGINLERGDTITIETYTKEKSFWTAIQTSDEVFKLVIFSGFLLASIVFLFGPLGIFLSKLGRNFSSIRIQQLGGTSKQGVPGEGQQADAIGATQPLRKDETDEGEKFGFINDSNLEDLITILYDSQVQDAVVVLNNIPELLSVKVFNALPPPNQRQIIEEQKQIKYMTSDTVKSVRDRIKDKVDNIYGGPVKISHLIQGCTQEIRKSLVNWLKQADPVFASKVADNLFEFVDIIEYDEQSFRRIFRAVGLQSFAQAIKLLDEDTIEKFLSKLNPDVALLLKEQIKIMPPSQKRFEEEQLKILNAVSRLVRDGEIEQISKAE